MDSIIFDLDGTLWNSLDVVLKAWNEALEESGAEGNLTKEDLRGVMGLQAHETREKLFPHLSDEQHRTYTEKASELESTYLRKQGGQLYSGVEHVLDRLAQQYNLYIVSNCQEGYIESFYAYHELDKYFLDFENPGRTGLSKGENIQLVMERNDVAKAVYVGDTKGDREAAKLADVPFVYAAYGFGEVDEFDYVIEEFEELLKLFG
ncbi:HAD family hydrolase [Planococcus sp. CP5-4]|uniref:HAD family hydrolase n=1 Tax=unclassified Planococcus (in: firmicutes) TaxID=2662419 RepID=UPI001C23E41E|nr:MULTISPECIES: HAD family hydrolase [unclassified Planococcus (in: firmicutes)]MBU9673915.1 HAD family hydrolase [Planococcus sp. CP5-4_YE]MBV0909785.1 HAD family hydrolase [Planococcus sp. CP5-4_UN]MBW6065269.1 HAD family hydrolase [Planococcus sp. CP5-4]